MSGPSGNSGRFTESDPPSPLEELRCNIPANDV